MMDSSLCFPLSNLWRPLDLRSRIAFRSLSIFSLTMITCTQDTKCSKLNPQNVLFSTGSKLYILQFPTYIRNLENTPLQYKVDQNRVAISQSTHKRTRYMVQFRCCRDSKFHQGHFSGLTYTHGFAVREGFFLIDKRTQTIKPSIMIRL